MLHSVCNCAPEITDSPQETIHANEGERVTLTVHYKGIPKPTITWTFKGSPVEENYETELSSDGSVILVCVEDKHTGEYVKVHSYYLSMHAYYDGHSLN